MTAYKEGKIEDECRVFNENGLLNTILRKLGIKQFACFVM